MQPVPEKQSHGPGADVMFEKLQLIVLLMTFYLIATFFILRFIQYVKFPDNINNSDKAWIYNEEPSN